jgi:hypothetical protein
MMRTKKGKVKVFKLAQGYGDVWGSGRVAPSILNQGNNWRRIISPGPFTPE